MGFYYNARSWNLTAIIGLCTVSSCWTPKYWTNLESPLITRDNKRGSTWQSFPVPTIVVSTSNYLLIFKFVLILPLLRRLNNTILQAITLTLALLKQVPGYKPNTSSPMLSTPAIAIQNALTRTLQLKVNQNQKWKRCLHITWDHYSTRWVRLHMWRYGTQGKQWPLANNQKEYKREDTLTYKYMSDKDQKILKELPKMIKNLLPSKNSYPNLSITNMFISTSFRLQNETPGVGGHTPAQFVC